MKDYPENSFEKYIRIMERERQTDRKRVSRADVACFYCRFCIAMGR